MKNTMINMTSNQKRSSLSLTTTGTLNSDRTCTKASKTQIHQEVNMGSGKDCKQSNPVTQ